MYFILGMLKKATSVLLTLQSNSAKSFQPMQTGFVLVFTQRMPPHTKRLLQRKSSATTI